MNSDATSVNYIEDYCCETIANSNSINTRYQIFLLDNSNFKTKFSQSPVFVSNRKQLNEEKEKVEIALKKILAEKKGVIINETETDVEIKFEKETVVVFSKNIFPEETSFDIGTNINYQICMSEEGYRYQNFEKCVEENAEEKNKELLELISEI